VTGSGRCDDGQDAGTAIDGRWGSRPTIDVQSPRQITAVTIARPLAIWLVIEDGPIGTRKFPRLKFRVTSDTTKLGVQTTWTLYLADICSALRISRSQARSKKSSGSTFTVRVGTCYVCQAVYLIADQVQLCMWMWMYAHVLELETAYNLALDSCFCIVSATMRRWILPVAVLGMTSVK
jgi:hypothetical protein